MSPQSSTETATIYALSSGAGIAGVAVVRLSGSGVRDVLVRLTGSVPQPRLATLSEIRQPDTKALIDKALVLYFPSPASFTGEDVAELHIHGGRATLAALFDCLASEPMLRMAEAGEFTRRALDHGKLDLTEAEGLIDLINADTEAQRAQALRQTLGNAHEIYDRWRHEIIGCLAMIEAELDFSDEEDVPGSLLDAFPPRVEALSAEISSHLADGRRGEIIRDGYRVVLAGPPNVGKSSILNALADRDVAIVSDEAGTTRDTIEVHLDLLGIPVIVTDTAGLRDTDSKVEREGIRRTHLRIEEADLVIAVTEAGQPVPDMKFGLHVANKLDAAITTVDPAADLSISATTGQNMDQLVDAISNRARLQLESTEPVLITQARHRTHLEQANVALTHLLANPATDLELRAEDLRMAATAIGRITGRIDIEDVLDKLFSSFCIGK